MTWVAVAIGASAVVGAGASIYSANQASDAIGEGSDAQTALARESRDIVNAQTQPYREAGYTALNDLMGLVGLDAPASVQSAATGGDSALGLPGARGGTVGPPEGLTAIPGATWRNRPVFTDGQGGVYSGRGRDWTAGQGVEYLGAASENMRFDGTRIKAGGGGILDYRDGQFYPGRGARQQPIELPSPTPGTNPVTGDEYRINGAGGVDRIATVGPGDTTGAAVTGGSTAQQSIADRVRSDPSYQFRLNEGNRALTTSAAARGGFGTGHDRRMTRYAQDYASTEYSRIFDRVASIAGIGVQSSNQYGNAVLQTGAQAGAAAGDAAYSRASAYTAQGNAIGNAINQGAQAVGYWNQNRALTYGDPGFQYQGPPTG